MTEYKDYLTLDELIEDCIRERELYPGQLYFWEHNPDIRRAEIKFISREIARMMQ